MTDLERLLVTRADIARLAGVKRPAVTNWERRHGDFPKPTPSPDRPDVEVFRADEVADWLDRRKVSARVREKGEVAGTTFGHRFRAGLGGRFSPQVFVDGLMNATDNFRGEAAPAELMMLMLAVTYVWGRAPESRQSVDSLLSSVRDVLGRDVGGREQVGALAEIFYRQGPSTQQESAAVFELAVSHYRNTYGRRQGSEYFTPRSVARTMARLLAAEGSMPRTIHDPFCRAGEVLTAVMAELPHRETQPSVTGTSPDPDALGIAAMNLGTHGVADAVLRNGMEVEAPQGEFVWPTGIDWIATNPPFAQRLTAKAQSKPWRYGRPGSRGDFAWLQHVVCQLAPGGRAAVVMPDGAGFAGGRAQQVRSAMIEDGVVECVVALPSMLFASTTIPVNIWVLARPEYRPRQVLLIDGSQLGEISERSVRVLSDADVSAIAESYAAWKVTSHGSVSGRESAPSQVVSFDDLRQQGYRLTPRFMTVPDDLHVDSGLTEEAVVLRKRKVAAAEIRLRQLSEDVGGSLDVHWRGREGAAGPEQTVDIPSGWWSDRLGALADVTVGPGGRRRTLADDTGPAVPMVRPADVRGHRILHSETALVPEREAQALSRYRLRAGDLVMTRTGTVGRCGLVTDAEEDWLFGNLVRIRPATSLYSEYLLGFLDRPETGKWIARRLRGSTGLRSIATEDLRDLPVLVPPLAEQRKIGDALNALDKKRRKYAELIAVLDEYRDDLADLLMAGQVSPSVRR